MGIEKGLFNRTRLLVGDDMMELISRQRVIIFGVGGVGSWCAESLVRSGIGHLTIVDSDRVCMTNVNRQLQATSKTVGKVKVDVLRERLLEINPTCDVVALQKIYSEDTAPEFNLDDYDYVIDCIDSLKDKVLLIQRATSSRATFFSSMGAALKMDPTKSAWLPAWRCSAQAFQANESPSGTQVPVRLQRGSTREPGRKPHLWHFCLHVS